MSEDQSPKQSPFTKPGWLISAGVILIIVVVGITLSIQAVLRPNTPNGQAATTVAVTSEASGHEPTLKESSAAASTSVCGLTGDRIENPGRIPAPPEATWEYQGMYPYPTSSTYGPAAATDDGIRYCYQRSPEGAVFAAANAIAQGSAHEKSLAFAEYFLAQGPMRSAALDKIRSEQSSTSSTSSSRITISGFKLLTYDGSKAKVDIALTVASTSSTSRASAVYDLVWEDGDWKWVIQDIKNPAHVSQIPDLIGYTTWGA